jgi:hypothetical protein
MEIISSVAGLPPTVKIRPSLSRLKSKGEFKLSGGAHYKKFKQFTESNIPI